MTEAALNGLEEAADFDVVGWNLNLDKLVVLLLGGVDLSVLVVDVGGDVLSQTVSKLTELLVFAVNFVGVVAVGALASVHLEVVQRPALGVVYWAGH